MENINTFFAEKRFNFYLHVSVQMLIFCMSVLPSSGQTVPKQGIFLLVAAVQLSLRRIYGVQVLLIIHF